MLKRIADWIQEWLIGEDLPPSTANFLPIAIGAALLAKKVFSAIGNKKKADAEKKAWEDKQRYNKEAAEFQTGKMNQRTQGIANLLTKMQPFIKTTTYGRGGNVESAGPDYQIDPELLKQKLAMKVPVAPTEADPSKGAGWQLGGDIAGAAGDSMMTYFMGGMNPQAQATNVAGLPGGAQPFNPALGAGMFKPPSNCPPGQIC